tara:strand:- start:12664 stop:14460 length:1797 start_codon:yes stop_codon:yes gene_type:complete
MSRKKIVPVKYTSRDFHSIKKDLVDHAKRYYPNTFKDFNDASFGSLMLDTVAYVGDMLSFYLDYSVNESFLETSIEYENVLNHANQLGYKYRNSPSSTGICDFYVAVPASTITGGPNESYFPIILAGTTLQSTNGTMFTLVENVSFESAGYGDREVYERDDNGVVTYYLLRAHGRVVSGELVEEEIVIGDFERFKKATIVGTDIGEVVSVFDSEGKEYFEVDYLSQNIIYKAIPNLGDNKETVPSIFKPFAVPRRFVVEQKRDRTVLQFGYGSEEELKNKSLVDPADIALQVDGRTYVTDSSFDPIRITKTDKFGVAPANTTLVVTYRKNTNENVNVGTSQITEITKTKVRFKNQSDLNFAVRQYIISNIEVDNPEPILGDISTPTTEEIKRRAIDIYAMQNRAVTIQDYKAAVYSMPAQFGAVKRCSIERDVDSGRRNLKIYVLAEDANGKFIATNETLKNNLRNYLNNIKMINDTADIIDASVVNICIEFEIRVEREVNKEDARIRCINEIVDELEIPKEIGEPFYTTDIIRILRNVDGVIDVLNVKLINKVGGIYSDVEHPIESNMSAEGTILSVESDMVLEVKYPFDDIVGIVK